MSSRPSRRSSVESPAMTFASKYPGGARQTSREDSYSFFRSAVLTAWDNIMGPKALSRWSLPKEGKTKLEDSFKLPETNEFLRFIANHTLNGEICRDFSGGDIDVKVSTFCLNEEHGGTRNVASSTFVFGAAGEDGADAVHSLALLFDAEKLEAYFVIHDQISERIKRFVAKYRVLRERPQLRGTALDTLTNDVGRLQDFVTHWRRAGLHSRVACEETYFGRHHAIDEAFLRKAVVSHLATGGCSVVVGRCPHKANLMIGTLAILLQPHERRCCTYLQPTRYFPGLQVQGILKDSVECGEALTQDLLLSAPTPTTIVDIDDFRILRSSSILKHSRRRREMLKRELEQLHGVAPHLFEETSRLTIFDDKFENFSFDETIVNDFFAGLRRIREEAPAPDGGDNDSDEKIEDAVVGFRRGLVQQARDLVDVVDGTLKNLDVATSLSSGDPVSKFLEARGLNPKGDLSILISTAERLSPGFCEVFDASFGAFFARRNRSK